MSSVRSLYSAKVGTRRTIVGLIIPDAVSRGRVSATATIACSATSTTGDASTPRYRTQRCDATSPLRMSPEPVTGNDPDVLLLAALVAAGLMSGRMFYRWQTRKDGLRERYWRNAGGWEIAGLGIIAAILIVGMGRG